MANFFSMLPVLELATYSKCNLENSNDCLTATGSPKMGKIKNILNMTAVNTIRMSSDKRNGKHIVEKASGVFLWGDLHQDDDPRSLR